MSKYEKLKNHLETECKFQIGRPVDHPYHVHSNQINAASEAILRYGEGGGKLPTRWVILLAEPQSGKTGAYFSIAYGMVNNPFLQKEFGIKNVFLITGMNETHLGDQFEKDFATYFDDGEDKSEMVLKNDRLKAFINIVDKQNDGLLSNPNLSEKEMIKQIEQIRKDSLLLIDESHYGTLKESKLHQFLTKVVGIKPIGNSEYLRNNNIYILSVSATPVAEMLSNSIDGRENGMEEGEVEELFFNEDRKSMISLIPGSGYYGIKDFFKDEKISQSYYINSPATIKRFSDDLSKQAKRMNSLKRNGYVFVRGTEKELNMIKNSRDIRLTWDIEDVHGMTSTAKLDFLKKTPNPDRPTLVLIKGILRAGKRLDGKENIFMCRETPKSLSDTTAQGLLGRMCGYYTSGEHPLVEMQCDMEAAKKHKEWIESGYKPEKSPDARNIQRIRESKSFMPLCVPLSIDFDKKFLDDLEKTYKYKKGEYSFAIINKILSEEKSLLPIYKKLMGEITSYKEPQQFMGSTYYSGGVNINNMIDRTKDAIREGELTFQNNYKSKEEKKDSSNIGKCYSSIYRDGNTILIAFGRLMGNEKSVRKVKVSDNSMYNSQLSLEIV